MPWAFSYMGVGGPLQALPYDYGVLPGTNLPGNEEGWTVVLMALGLKGPIVSANPWHIWAITPDLPPIEVRWGPDAPDGEPSRISTFRYLLRYWIAPGLWEDIFLADFPELIGVQRFLAPVANVNNHFPETWGAIQSLIKASEERASRKIIRPQL